MCAGEVQRAARRRRAPVCVSRSSWVRPPRVPVCACRVRHPPRVRPLRRL